VGQGAKSLVRRHPRKVVAEESATDLLCKGHNAEAEEFCLRSFERSFTLRRAPHGRILDLVQAGIGARMAGRAMFCKCSRAFGGRHARGGAAS
jgi:hypothetical protein